MSGFVAQWGLGRHQMVWFTEDRVYLGHGSPGLCEFFRGVAQGFAMWTPRGYRCGPLRIRYHDPDPPSPRERDERFAAIWGMQEA